MPVGSDGAPLFATTDQPSEIWLTLVEKAFAKFSGSYSALVEGTTAGALASLTGAPVEYVTLSTAASDDDALWLFLRSKLEEGRLGLGASWTTGRPPRYGLLGGRCYAVIKCVEAGPRKKRMVQLGKSWADGPVPGGRWAPAASAWRANPDVVRDCNFDGTDPSIFWLEVDEVGKAFDVAWGARIFDESVWTTQRRASVFPDGPEGGCFNQATWVANPQFFLELPVKADVALSVAQDGNHALGVAIVETPDVDGPEDVEKISTISADALKALTKRFVRGPEVRLDLKLPAGNYAIVPMTLRPPSGLGGGVAVTTRCTGGGVEIRADFYPRASPSFVGPRAAQSFVGPRASPSFRRRRTAGFVPTPSDTAGGCVPTPLDRGRLLRFFFFGNAGDARPNAQVRPPTCSSPRTRFWRGRRQRRARRSTTTSC